MRISGFTFIPEMVVVNAVISSNTKNVNFRSKIIAAGWNGTSPVTATVTINSGVIVGSTNVNEYSLTIDGSWPSGSTLFLVNNGKILGRGGDGGRGGNSVGSGYVGTTGGDALSVSVPVSITNIGYIAGGGGGGGGGAGKQQSGLTGGGGGGGQGSSGGTAGQGGGGSSFSSPGISKRPAFNGGTGTALERGSGGGGATLHTYGPASHSSSSYSSPGYDHNYQGGKGGSGGTLGNTGGTGAGGPPGHGATGSDYGYYIRGNSYVTWLANGTRLGHSS